MRFALHRFLLLGAIVAYIWSLPISVSAQPDTFKNPLLPSGADPWVITWNGFFYYMDTTGKNLTIWRTRDITDLAHATKVVVWTPPLNTAYSREIWAPELHRLNGKWYIYFAADDGENANHRIYVLENSSDDPQKGTWTFKGKVSDVTNRWAIDPTIFRDKGHLYMVWSGWEGSENGLQQLYIAEMANPWTIISPRVMISTPTYDWEKFNHQPGRLQSPAVYVNEAPEILQHNNKIFLIYSASGCWTDHYALGVLEMDAGADPLQAASWKKFDHPFFQQNPQARVFGPGHNGFFTSPDGKEDWIIYHANSSSGQGCGAMRSPRIQEFTWSPDGTPNFGTPFSTDLYLHKPSH